MTLSVVRPSPQRSAGGTDRELRRAAVIYVIAIVLHGIDHLRRGVDVVTMQVRSAGGVQFLLAVAVLALVLRRHRWAPSAAAALGFSSAVLFVAVHFLPFWGSFSVSFTGGRVGPNVTALSWIAALVEVITGLALGWAGARALERPSS